MENLLLELLQRIHEKGLIIEEKEVRMEWGIKRVIELKLKKEAC